MQFLRDALGHCPKDLQQLVGAAIRPIFRVSSLEEARRLLAETVTHLEARVPKVARLLGEAEPDLLAFYGFPSAHRSKLRSTNPLERVNREIGRRTDLVGVFPNDAALLRLAGSLLIEQNDVRVGLRLAPGSDASNDVPGLAVAFHLRVLPGAMPGDVA